MALFDKLRSAIFGVIVLEFFGLVAAVIFASSLSSHLTHPFGIVFAVDYIFIILSAVLAELAAPSEEAAKLTTSFVVATSTLAPLAVFVSKALSKDPEEHNILKDLIPNWYHSILLISVIVCTGVAISAALALGRIGINNSESSQPSKNPPGPFERTALLSASIFLFGGYTFLVNDWKPPNVEVNVNAIDLVLPTVGFIGLISIFCWVPWIIGPSVRSYSVAYRKGSLDVIKRLRKAVPSTGPAILALLIISLLGGLLLQNHWVPAGFAESVRGLLGSFLDVSADDLARLLFLFAGIIAVFAFLAILILAAFAILNWLRPPLVPQPPQPLTRTESEPSTPLVSAPLTAHSRRPPPPSTPQRPQITIAQMLLWLVATVTGLWVLAMSVSPQSGWLQGLPSQVIATILVAIYGATLIGPLARMSRWMVVIYGLLAALACFWDLWSEFSNSSAGSPAPAVYAGAFFLFTVSFACSSLNLSMR
jgi:hypothetical protein